MLREWLLLKGGKPGGQTVSKYRCETIYLKDFEVVKSWRGVVRNTAE